MESQCMVQFCNSQSSIPRVSYFRKPNSNNINQQQKHSPSSITNKTIVENSKRIKAIKLENRCLRKKLKKANNFLEALGDKCDISKITKQILDDSGNILTNVEESGIESDTEATQDSLEDQSENIIIQIIQDDRPSNYVSAIEKNNQEVITICNDFEERIREERNTQIDCLNTEGQVQITFLPGSDTAKEGLLKRNLKQLAENDIIKSKKIRELNNINFIKTKVIEELRAEIAKLKEKHIKLANLPI